MLNGAVEGDPEVVVKQLAKIEEGEPGTITFLAHPKYEAYIYNTQASVIVINTDLELQKPVSSTLIRVQDARVAFSVLLEKFNTLKNNKMGIEEPSFIHPSATIGKNVYIGAFAYIGADVVVGDDTKIYPHVYVGDNTRIGSASMLFSGVKIYTDCRVGNQVVIHSGAVIGGDGFGFAPQGDGRYTKVSQIGNVIIEDDVEVGANTCIDRATMGSTIIRKGVKLDNLIQIAHNADIGQNTVIAAQSGVSGSSKVYENCIIGGQVGIVGHITVAANSQIQAKSGVNRSIEDAGKKWGGAPFDSYNRYLRSSVVIQRLPELEKKIEELEKLLHDLKQQGRPDEKLDTKIP